MGIGPWLVFRGLILGIVGLVVFSLVITSSLSLPPVARAESLATQTPLPDVSTPESGDQVVSIETAGYSCDVSSKFPPAITQWCDLITQYANNNFVPPDLIAALIWQESGGNSDAYSHSGAVGLMQVMPKDGISASFMCKNGPCFSNRPSSAELFDPDFNIKYGTRMLAGLYNRSGSWREALKSYGPMDVGYSYADKVLSIYENHRQ
jgi:soluble lytic murein transglycosylase-like protein